MEQEEVSAWVVQHFPQLSEPNLQREMAEVGIVRRFRKDEVLMDYGSYIRQVPLVIEGSIKVMREGDDGHEILLYFLQAGETCSVSFTCCMMEKQSAIRTVAEDDTLIISIPLQYVDQWMHTYRSWRNFVMMSYDARILELVDTIDRIAFKKLDQRLLAYLQKKADARQSHVIDTTHQEIAYDLNASREAISRLLKQLELEEYVTLGRNRITLKQLPGA